MQKGQPRAAAALGAGRHLAIAGAHKRKGTFADWLLALRARKRGKVAAVALADKLARIVWAMMTTGEAFCAAAFARA